MRVLIWIARFLAPVTLVMAILAALIVERALTSPTPVLTANEVATLAANVKTANSTLIASSIGDLIGVKALEVSPEQKPISSQLYGNAAYALDASRNGVIDSLKTQSGESKSEAGIRLLSSPELSTALDQADALYKDKLDKSTESAVDIYRNSMSLEAPFFIKYLGFLGLSKVIERDLLSYREMNSLDFNDAKLTYYTDESAGNKAKVEEIRTEANDKVRKMDEDLEVLYGSSVDELVNNFVQYAKSGKPQSETDQNIAVVKWVRGLLDEFNPAVSQIALEKESPRVGVDTSAWVNLEKDTVVAFSKASGIGELKIN